MSRLQCVAHGRASWLGRVKQVQVGGSIRCLRSHALVQRPSMALFPVDRLGAWRIVMLDSLVNGSSSECQVFLFNLQRPFT